MPRKQIDSPEAVRAQVRQTMRRNNTLDDLKDAVAKAKAKGLIRGPGEKVPVNVGESPAHANLDGIRVQFVRVTPEMADAWLKGNNKGNRTLRESTVEAYARDMSNGDWMVNHQGVAFDEHDTLLDGQHRLAAIVRSGETITLLVVTGLPAAGRPASVKSQGKRATTMDTVDRGAARSIADLLGLQHGIEQPRIVAMASAAVARLCISNPESCKRMTTPTVLGIIEAFKEQIKYAVENRSTTCGLRQAAVLGAIAFGYGPHPEETHDFYERLQTGENLARTNAILPLRNGLLSNATGGAGGFRAQQQCAVDVLQHLFMFIHKKPAEKLTHSNDGWTYFKSRQPERVAKVAALFPASQSWRPKLEAQ